MMYRSSFFVALACIVCGLGACNASTNQQAANPAQETASSNNTTAAKVSPEELNAAIAQYKIYIQAEVDEMVKKNQVFTDAVIAGDLEKAQQLYGPTRVHWERAEPIAELFSDLDGSVDARADDFEKREADPNFTGYHRIEKALFQDKTTEGMKPIAQKLMADSIVLQKRIAELQIEPKNMVGGAAALIEEIAATKVTGEENRYSGTDLWDFQANLEGSEKIIGLLRPMLTKADPQLLAKSDQNFAAIRQVINKYKTPDGGFVNYKQVTQADVTALKTLLSSHSEDLAKLRGTLGVD